MNGARVQDARRRLALDPGDPRCAIQLANALWLADGLAEALSWARWATRNGPDHPLAWRCLGNVLLDLGRYNAADEAYRRADPRGVDAATQYNRSRALLGLAAHGQAWLLAEQRLAEQPLPDGAWPGPWWQGWPDARMVTIWSEQGLGDTLQFLRWLPALMAVVPRVQLVVQPPLQRLVERGLQWLGPDLCVASAAPGEPTPCHGSLLSLPWRLGLAEPPWPGPGTEGYLRIGRQRQRPSGAPLRIGLLWGTDHQCDGHVRERNYRRKSVLGVALRALVDGLAALPVELIALQVGPDRDPAVLQGVRWGGQLDPQADFLALAEQLQQLDLLISVDTAGAHLAGAMGLPAWLLLPWAAASRWGRDSLSTAWYPSLRLWRQPRHGDWLGLWPSLLAAVRQLAQAA